MAHPGPHGDSIPPRRLTLNLKDSPIAVQLNLGLGLTLFFVVLLGGLAWRQSNLLWLKTKTIYDHPLQVRGAVGQLEVDVERMSRYVRDLFLAQDDQERAAALQGIEIEKADAEEQYAILKERYLGPREDILTLHQELMKWHVLREETIHLLRRGETTVAEGRIRAHGVQHAQAEVVRSRLHTIDDFAHNKGNQLFQLATAEKGSLDRQLAVIVVTILLLLLTVSRHLLRGIKEPLRELHHAAQQFREERLNARCGYASANEFGALAVAFNAMAAAVETQMHTNRQAAELADTMARHTEAHAFCRELLVTLIEQTGSQLGAVYLLNPEKTEFEHFESIGLAAEGRATFSIQAHAGEFGAALATGRMQRVSDIPADTVFTFSAVSGEFQPREIVTLPLLSGQETVAVISLASLRPYDDQAIRLLETVHNTLTARMNGVLAFRQIQELAERLDHQNRELNNQRQELIAQAEELTFQNTELEMQKSQLDEANRLKSAFLSNMSHELRTPLNSVIALSGVLRRRLASTIPEEESGFLEVIERNGRHLLSLINDILDLSRIEAGREEICLNRFSLLPLVAEVVEMVEPQAREKGITLHHLVASDLPALTSDPHKVRHILQNLIANAVKFTETGTVEVSARLEDQKLQVTVRDTGIGIAAEQLSRIFEEFRQADESTSRRYGGTGLGLAIAKRYATLLHGDLTVASTPGQGSTFTLTLPLTLEGSGPGPGDPPGRAAGQRTTCADSGVSGQGRSILLVEDNEPAVIQMTDILTCHGYQVQVARNGKEGLALLKTAMPDAMILDLMMPEMDGFEVLRQLRGAALTEPLPVLILTAKHVTREELSLLQGNHIHQLIQKGEVGRRELLAAVGRMFSPPAQAAPSPPDSKPSDEELLDRTLDQVLHGNE